MTPGQIVTIRHQRRATSKPLKSFSECRPAPSPQWTPVKKPVGNATAESKRPQMNSADLFRRNITAEPPSTLHLSHHSKSWNIYTHESVTLSATASLRWADGEFSRDQVSPKKAIPDSPKARVLCGRGVADWWRLDITGGDANVLRGPLGRAVSWC